jgi:hypothetical protein
MKKDVSEDAPPRVAPSCGRVFPRVRVGNALLVDDRLGELATMIEPLVILLMGGILVAAVVLSVMLAMFNIAALAQQGI